ncbi:hypothetical protein [Dethiothermospora halolimnae]|uniref:hypothetical protein n=1 Tax=Dethiothermospora halolimnae TaxID=3114390 RepID=UPI003CCC4663
MKKGSNFIIGGLIFPTILISPIITFKEGMMIDYKEFFLGNSEGNLYGFAKFTYIIILLCICVIVYGVIQNIKNDD